MGLVNIKKQSAAGASRKGASGMAAGAAAAAAAPPAAGMQTSPCAPSRAAPAAAALGEAGRGKVIDRPGWSAAAVGQAVQAEVIELLDSCSDGDEHEQQQRQRQRRQGNAEAGNGMGDVGRRHGRGEGRTLAAAAMFDPAMEAVLQAQNALHDQLCEEGDRAAGEGTQGPGGRVDAATGRVDDHRITDHREKVHREDDHTEAPGQMPGLVLGQVQERLQHGVVGGKVVDGEARALVQGVAALQGWSLVRAARELLGMGKEERAALVARVR